MVAQGRRPVSTVANAVTQPGTGLVIGIAAAHGSHIVDYYGSALLSAVASLDASKKSIHITAGIIRS
jgi:hypothetical protein